MSPTNTQAEATAHYASTDAVNRHDFAVQKHRKSASTGGGRAWSEDEEVYLLQNRLQKMPYKHIASHLKKTELACRLHYHQLSHGSNRRKQRTSSISSSGSSVRGHSPSITASGAVPFSMPSPIHENSASKPNSPPTYPHTYSPGSPAHVQLPAAWTLLQQPQSRGPSPPRTLLPKPSPHRRTFSESATPALRLVTPTTIPPISSFTTAAIPNGPGIDEAHLRQLYEKHRASFWSVIASEYGIGIDALALEDYWRRNCANMGMPPTPSGSPNMRPAQVPMHISFKPRPRDDLPTPVTATESSSTSKTSINALLGIDACPRSPEEREVVKRLEERRGSREVLEVV